MKRSDMIVLGLMGATVAFTGFGRIASGGTFRDAQACEAAGVRVLTCTDGYRAAFNLHVQKAPRFGSPEECGAATDAACFEDPWSGRTGASKRYMPAMSGFAITEDNCDPAKSNCSSGSGGGAGSAYAWRSSGYRSEPIYESRSERGAARSLAALYDRPATGGPEPRPSESSGMVPRLYTLASPNMKTDTVSRGGFGWRGGRISGRG